jgi:hypothetical protein
LVQAAVITAVVVKEQGAPSEESPPRASLGRKADRLQVEAVGVGPRIAVQSAAPAAVQEASGLSAAKPPTEIETPAKRNLSSEEIESLITRARALIAVGDVDGARSALKLAAEADNATAALELGGTYDPAILQKQRAPTPTASGVQRTQTTSVWGFQLREPVTDPTVANEPMAKAWYDSVGVGTDVAIAKAWYEKARDLGSTEAAVRLERLTGGRGTRR